MIITDIDQLLCEDDYLLVKWKSTFMHNDYQLYRISDVRRGDRTTIKVQNVETNKHDVLSQKYIKIGALFIRVVTKEENPEYFL